MQYLTSFPQHFYEVVTLISLVRELGLRVFMILAPNHIKSK